jgi:hypothetical protein
VVRAARHRKRTLHPNLQHLLLHLMHRFELGAFQTGG